MGLPAQDLESRRLLSSVLDDNANGLDESSQGASKRATHLEGKRRSTLKMGSNDSMDKREGGKSEVMGVDEYHQECEKLFVLPSLAVATQLQAVDFVLAHYAVGDSGGQALAAGLRVNTQMRTLRLCYAALANKAVAAIANALAKNRACQIKHLDLEGNKAGPQAAEALASMLAVTSSLQVLSLKGNPLHSSGIQKLGKAVAHQNQTLTELDISDTGAGDPSSSVIVEMLAAGRLKKLSLAWNPIVNAWPAIGQALQSNRSLQVLDLGSTSMGTEGGAAVCLGVAHHRSVKTLDVSDCRLSEEGTKVLANALIANRSLETLIVDGRAAKDLIKALSAAKSTLKLGLKRSNRSTPSEEDWLLEFDDSADVSKGLADSLSDILTTTQDANAEAECHKELNELAARLALESDTEHCAPLPAKWQSLEKAYVCAKEAAMKDPKDIPALQTLATAATGLKHCHEAAMRYLQAMAIQEDASIRKGFEMTMAQLLNQRSRYMPANRTLILKVKCLADDLSLEDAEDMLRLSPELEGALEHLSDLLQRHQEPEEERSALRLVLKELESELRKIFNFYGGFKTVPPTTPKSPSKKQPTTPGSSSGTGLGRSGSAAQQAPGPSEERQSEVPELIVSQERKESPLKVNQGKPLDETEAKSVEDTVAKTVKDTEAGPPEERQKIPLRALWRLARDCKLIGRPLPLADLDKLVAHSAHAEDGAGAEDPHNGAAVQLEFGEFVEVLCRVAWVLQPCCSALTERFQAFVEHNLRPLVTKDSRDRLQKQVSASSSSEVMQKHRVRLLKVYRYFCHEALEATTSSETPPPPEESRSRSPSQHGRQSPEPRLSTDLGPSKDLGASREAGPWRSAVGPPLLEGGGQPEGALTEPKQRLDRSKSRVNFGEGEADVPSLSQKPKLERQKTRLPTSHLLALGNEEGPLWMTFNDMLHMCEKLDLYSPQLNLTKVKSVVEKVTLDKDLTPQEHPTNARAKMVFEEFVEVIARFGMAATTGNEPAASRLQKEADGGWNMLVEYLENTIYPHAKKVLPGRL